METLPSRNDAPDEIYLVRTELEKWEVWILKEGDTLFQNVIELGPYYLDAVN
jgi:hypothetical protein